MQLTQEKPEAIVESFEQSQGTLLKWMADTQITTTEEQKNAEDMLIHARKALKDVESKRKELLEPVFETRDRINALFKPLKEKLDMGIYIVDKALKAYHTEQVQLAEAEATLALAEQAAKIAEAQETGEIVELHSPTGVMPEAPGKTSHAHLGSVTYRDDIDVTIVNPLLVPRDLCDPNLSRIRARAKSGVTEIPGVLITHKYTTQTRGGN